MLAIPTGGLMPIWRLRRGANVAHVQPNCAYGPAWGLRRLSLRGSEPGRPTRGLRSFKLDISQINNRAPKVRQNHLRWFPTFVRTMSTRPRDGRLHPADLGLVAPGLHRG